MVDVAGNTYGTTKLRTNTNRIIGFVDRQSTEQHLQRG